MKFIVLKKNLGKPGAGGGKGVGAAKLSKKDQILKESLDKKTKEQAESDKKKIEYATGIKSNVSYIYSPIIEKHSNFKIY